MKRYLSWIVLLALFLSACSIFKSVESDQEKSTIKIDYTQNGLATSIFKGRVTDKTTGEGLMQARVVLQSTSGSGYFGVMTDEDGHFFIDLIPFGSYHLEISYFSHDPIVRDLEIKEQTNCTVEVQLYQMPMEVEKPVIYLYPLRRDTIHVQLFYSGTITHSYPEYPVGGWSVTADPDGTLWDKNNQEYYALFWEGTPAEQIIPTDGFVIPGKETAAFLEEKLAYLGLNRREANEFMMYWLPRMEDNPYNFIHFAGDSYLEQAALDIRPAPETIIRVMMLTQPLQKKIAMPLQDLSPLKKIRKGYTVVEWGGSVIYSAREM